jgi:hypothetical protein
METKLRKQGGKMPNNSHGLGVDVRLPASN